MREDEPFNDFMGKHWPKLFLGMDVVMALADSTKTIQHIHEIKHWSKVNMWSAVPDLWYVLSI